MKQSFDEADGTSQSLQADFDIMLRNILDKCYQFPGVALLLGIVLEHRKIKHLSKHVVKMITLLYPLSTLPGMEFWEIMEVCFSAILGGHEFLNYFMEFLENPKQSKAHVFDQQRFVAASEECLQLCLSSHHKFSKKVANTAPWDNALRRSKPFVWISRLGVHSRIRKGRHQLDVRQWKQLKAQYFYPWVTSFPDDSPEHEYHRALVYQCALDLLPCFLEKSPISLELAEVLHRCTFTTMAQKFPRRLRLAKEAITKYILWVESAVGILNC
jgi:hypothetical protein